MTVTTQLIRCDGEGCFMIGTWPERNWYFREAGFGKPRIDLCPACRKDSDDNGPGFPANGKGNA